MSSSGARHGVINLLKLRDLKKIEKYNLYQITAYRTSKKYRYYTFVTPEATKMIDSYLEYRKKHGKNLKGNSPLIREQFSTIDKLKVNNPKHLTTKAIRHMVNEVLTKYTGLRKKLEYDYENNRKIGKNSTMLTHAFRKFFNTECAKAGVYPDIIEKMLGHQLQGVRDSYLKLDPQTLLEGTKEVKGYVSAIGALTINDENRLKMENESLREEDEYKEYLIQQKLKQKNIEIEKMQQQLQTLMNESNRSKQEFITIAKQIQDLHYTMPKPNPDPIAAEKEVDEFMNASRNEKRKIILQSISEKNEKKAKQKKELEEFIQRQEQEQKDKINNY